MKCIFQENIKLGKHKIHKNVTLFLSAFAQDLPKSVKKHGKCKKHIIAVSLHHFPASFPPPWSFQNDGFTMYTNVTTQLPVSYRR